jgi:hypothetical protein
MKVGLQIPHFTWPGGNTEIGVRLAEIGHIADNAGFASLWVMDHFFQLSVLGEAEDPMLEGYSALSFLAAITKRVTLGTLVTGVIYRYPGILVKMVRDRRRLVRTRGKRPWYALPAAEGTLRATRRGIADCAPDVVG